MTRKSVGQLLTANGATSGLLTNQLLMFVFVGVKYYSSPRAYWATYCKSQTPYQVLLLLLYHTDSVTAVTPAAAVRGCRVTHAAVRAGASFSRGFRFSTPCVGSQRCGLPHLRSFVPLFFALLLLRDPFFAVLLKV